jgi:hypothetical protein
LSEGSSSDTEIEDPQPAAAKKLKLKTAIDKVKASNANTPPEHTVQHTGPPPPPPPPPPAAKPKRQRKSPANPRKMKIQKEAEMYKQQHAIPNANVQNTFIHRDPATPLSLSGLPEMAPNPDAPCTRDDCLNKRKYNIAQITRLQNEKATKDHLIQRFKNYLHVAGLPELPTADVQISDFQIPNLPQLQEKVRRLEAELALAKSEALIAESQFELIKYKHSESVCMCFQY